MQTPSWQRQNTVSAISVLSAASTVPHPPVLEAGQLELAKLALPHDCGEDTQRHTVFPLVAQLQHTGCPLVAMTLPSFNRCLRRLSSSRFCCCFSSKRLLLQWRLNWVMVGVVRSLLQLLVMVAMEPQLSNINFIPRLWVALPLLLLLQRLLV